MGKVAGFMVAVWLFCIGTAVYGAYLAFKASIILGCISLLVAPLSFLYGVIAYFGTNVPMYLQAWINFPV